MGVEPAIQLAANSSSGSGRQPASSRSSQSLEGELQPILKGPLPDCFQGRGSVHANVLERPSY